ncbi:serine/threonine-protein kinase [Nocardia sp. SYP-A9097]|uniref:serine/threonine-protein kinase n=1 Tax=Nocardia sp. SYP-A9097 TaxID=2663237 RepID=UPI001891C9CA|nr:serine/threonine-protein kinase [Nocardia sp. SYP-A9097]
MTVQPLTHDDPRTIGRYRVLGVLGQGGMGRVLLGAGPDGRLVAIKQVHAHLLNQRGYRARFQREVSASTRVSGAFTAPVVDFDMDCETPWLASVFVVGVPLSQAVEECGPLPVPAVRALAAGLAVALQDIHRAGLVHRDLKPANVLLTADGPRVIDFGIAYMMENPGGLTETGSTLGSPAFMSPEQTLGEPITAASDMFALGSVLATAASGTNPFATSSVAYTLFQIAHGESDLRTVPAELRPVIAPCLHKDPDLRPTPAQLIAQLGRQSEGPAPWPEPIRRAIERQGPGLTGVAGDRDATLVGSRTPRSVGPLRTAEMTASGSRLRRKSLWLSFAALLMIATALAGVLVWKAGNNPRASSVADTSLTTLREADSCAWLRQALTRSVPAESGWDPNPATWTTSVSYTWGCIAKSGDQRLLVQPGDTTALMEPIDAQLNGMRLYGSDDSEAVGCFRGVKLGGGEQVWGITVDLTHARNCDFAVHVIERLLATRTTAPKWADAISLARIDPCEVVPHAALDATIGPLSQSPPLTTARSCHWDGSSTLEVGTQLSDLSTIRVDPALDLGNGRTAFPRTTSLSSVCELLYPVRTVANEQEIVSVRIDGVQGAREAHCGTARSILLALIGQLPAGN